MAQASLAVDGISKAFGETRAVRGLSLDAAPGEVIGLLGPNGAGKTTAIRILTTIYAPDSGSFAVDGIPYTRPSAIRQRIGVLPESAGYPLHQSGEEFVQYFARLFGQSRKSARETAKTLLAEVGLAERAASPISMYSRGMRQRLGVARALVNRPRVLFLDEPTLGLDPAGQRQILALISEAATERGATVILSTHFLDEVEEVCSRVIILNRGEVIAEGPVADIKRRAAPRTARVRVPEENHESALSALKRAPGVGDAQAVNGGRGLISATLDGSDTNAPIRALLEAGIPILFFELEGGKLSDAFLALTGEAGA
ncbi:MAG: ABC transporter ATP-binding protein [Chloroflexi bacterium]|nr:MAG: ABC transporter ATP-binding protein [Chloroflexota bacterium]